MLLFKRRAFLLVCLVVTLAVSLACAEGYLTQSQVKNIPFDRLVLEKPEALHAWLENTEPGHVTIVIDDAATNWHEVALSEQGFGVELKYLPPASDEVNFTINNGCLYGGVPGGSFEDKLGVIQSDIQGYGPVDAGDPVMCLNAYGIGTMDKAHLAFLPENQHKGDYTLICWGNFDCKPGEGMKENSAVGYRQRYYEQLTLSVRHTSLSPVSLPDLNFATQDMLAPMLNVRDYLTGKITGPGEMILSLPDSTAAIPEDDFESNPGGQILPIPLVLAAPDGAEFLSVTGDVNDSVQVNGNRQAEVAQAFWIYPESMVEEFHLTLSWLDGSGNPVANGLLTVCIEPCTKNLFPTYVADWKPVPASRVKLTNNIHNLGVEAMADDDGVVSITRDPSKHASGNDGFITASVIAPEQSCKYYRVISVGGSSIYGTGKQDMALSQIGQMQMKTVQPNGLTETIFASKPLVRHRTKSMDVYLQLEDYFPYGGGVWVIYWYDSPNATEPRHKEYLCQITDKMYKDTPIAVASNENQVPNPVQFVTAVKPKGTNLNWDGWQLVVRTDPQPILEAETIHYELTLVNETGAYRDVKLSEDNPLVLYFPYPDGYDMTTSRDFKLYHYASGSYTEKPESLTGQKTERGVRFEVTSLSPFVLDWRVPSPPQTGDATPLWGLCLLMALSAGTLLRLRRRKHA